MGLQIGDIVSRKAVSFSDLKGKVMAVDASNIIYQFLSTIRQRDGTPLQDSKGKITSHLSGLFYRNISLMNEGLKLVYVFDGEMPKLKHGTMTRRTEVKERARERYEKAKKKEDIEAMGKYSRQLARLTPKIAEESKELLKALGIQCVQAPSEAEAQASYMCKKRQAYAVASQDYDALLFQTPRLLQNLTLARKRRTVSGWVYISPEMIELQKVLNKLQINQDQLICLGILAGTDYNPKGVVGIGQKKALILVKKFRYPIKIFGSIEKIDFNWQKVFELFKKPRVKDVEVRFPKPDLDKVKKILLKREFSESRIDSALERLGEAKKKAAQKTLF